MTVRDIEHHLASTIGTEISRETISKITDSVLEEVLEWQRRPLDPILYLDAIVVKIRSVSRSPTGLRTSPSVSTSTASNTCWGSGFKNTKGRSSRPGSALSWQIVASETF